MATLRLLAVLFVGIALVSSAVALPVASPSTKAESEPQTDSGKGVVGGGIEAFAGGVDVGQEIAHTALNMAIVFISGAMQFMDKIEG